MILCDLKRSSWYWFLFLFQCGLRKWLLWFHLFYFLNYYTLCSRVYVHNMQVCYICIHVPCWCAAPINSSFILGISPNAIPPHSLQPTIHHIFFIHPSIDGHLSCFHILALVNSMAISMGVKISLWYTEFLFLDIYPIMELLNHMVILFLTFWGTSTLFS